MATEEGELMNGVKIQDATIEKEIEESSSMCGEAMDDIQAQTTIGAEKREGSPLEGPEAKRINSGEDAKREKKRKDAEWREKEKRILQPWQYETGRLLSEPPDINYRRIILHDQEKIDRLLENWDMPFTERCLQYQAFDAQVERNMLQNYKDWAAKMKLDASADGNAEAAAFFEDLHIHVKKDFDDVSLESLNGRHQETIRAGTTDMLEGGSRQVYSWYGEGWYYYETKQHQWLKEPPKTEHQYTLRRQQWQEEALTKVDQRYYDCVERRFYCYDQNESQWQAEQHTFREIDGVWFKYDKQKAQWDPEACLQQKIEKEGRSKFPDTHTVPPAPTAQDANSGEDDRKIDSSGKRGRFFSNS